MPANINFFDCNDFLNSFSYQVNEYLIVVFITVEYGRQKYWYCGDFSMHHIFVMYDSILYSYKIQHLNIFFYISVDILT